ncbi:MULTISPECIES: serine hydrolase [unclassified Dyella]|uniref:serine hydrolase n=1 Tax=unclassified Dyella TaxID=2634549 RepID=UPI0011AF9216|nr:MULTISPECIES: serine hydrolase [unclassified Dyella]MDR3447968.1 serine hydrolase [Dyella sp.]
MAHRAKIVAACAFLCIANGPLFCQAIPGTTHVPNDLERRINQIESCLPDPVIVKGEPPSCHTLAERMQALHVPGISVAVIHHGALEWAKGFGVERIGGEPITPETLFQAGSISKPISAMAALHLVQQGKLSLDSDVNSVLTTWKVPASPAAPGAAVTLRELLTHTAGFTVHGFPGYAANTPVPTLVQVLNGEKPANNGPIRLESVPGSQWKYSGGGYTVMQQLLLDASKRPFAELLRDTVLIPIGMIHSTYEQPLPTSLKADAATPYGVNEEPIPGGAHTYPEKAAAGLWTTPSDLARYVLEVQQSLQGKANHVLNPDLTKQMLTPGKGHWGLGLEISGSSTEPYFSHGGVDEGFESLLVGYEHNGEGAVVMTNAKGGGRLASQVMMGIAAAYAWPDFQPVVRTAIELDRSVLARYVGTYQLAPDVSLVFTLEDGQLMAQATNQHKFPVFPESETRFSWKVVNAEIEFFLDSAGHVKYVVFHQNGQDDRGIKK